MSGVQPTTPIGQYEVVFRAGRLHIYVAGFAVKVATFAAGIGKVEAEKMVTRINTANSETRTYYANPQQFPDRSDAVNLARNWLDAPTSGMHITTKGIRALAEGVMLMDSWILEVTKNAAPQASGATTVRREATPAVAAPDKSLMTEMARSNAPCTTDKRMPENDPEFFDKAMTLRNRYNNDEITGPQFLVELEKLHLRCAAILQHSAIGAWRWMFEQVPPDCSGYAISGLYLVVNAGNVQVAHWYPKRAEWADISGRNITRQVTHWQPFPAPPDSRGDHG